MSKSVVKKVFASVSAAVIILGCTGCSVYKDVFNSLSESSEKSVSQKTEPKSEPKVESKSEDASSESKGETVVLKEGKYIVGKEIKPGVYDLVSKGSFSIFDDGDSLHEALSTSKFASVTKLHAILVEGMEISIKESEIEFIPITDRKMKSYSEFSLYAGKYIVGKDIAPGKYIVTTPEENGSGNVFVDRSVNEILSHNDDFGKKEIELDLGEGQKLTLLGLKEVVFTPKK